MKKIYLLGVVFILSTFVGVAQTEQGKWILTGKTGLNFTRSESNIKMSGQKIAGSEENSFSVTPGIGYFVIDNLAVGLSSTFETTKTKGEINVTEKNFNIFPGVFYYFPTNSQVRPFAEAGLGYASYSLKGDSSGAGLQYGGLGYGGSLGVSYFISRQISLDLMAQYINTNLKNKSNKDLTIQGNAITGMIGFTFFL